MMARFVQYWLLVLFFFLSGASMAYLAVAFCVGRLDPSEWSEDGRIGCAVFSAIVGTALSAIVFHGTKPPRI